MKDIKKNIQKTLKSIEKKEEEIMTHKNARNTI
jgi:hypothetical protein